MELETGIETRDVQLGKWTSTENQRKWRLWRFIQVQGNQQLPEFRTETAS
jgi:hypothetical protein